MRISTSAAGLREMWPPSGRICACQLGVEPVEPGAGEPLLLATATGRSARSRSRRGGAAGPARLSTMPARSTLAWRSSERTKVAVEVVVGVVQDERRLRQEGERAPRRHVRRPTRSRCAGGGSSVSQSSTMARALERASGVSAARRCRSQPKQCSSRSQSSEGGPMSNGESPPVSTDMPGEGEAPVVDLDGDRRVGGPEIRRRDEELRAAAAARRAAGRTVRRSRQAATFARADRSGEEQAEAGRPARLLT